MTANISIKENNVLKHVVLTAFVSMFLLPDRASACSWDVWPCFAEKVADKADDNRSSRQKRVVRSRRRTAKSYYRRVAALKRRRAKRVVARSRARGRSVQHQTIGRIAGHSKPNRRKYLPILKRVKPRGLPIKLAMAVVSVESNWRAGVTGSVGEVGLMQIRAGTAQWMGGREVRRAKKEDVRRALFKPEFNLRIGTKYLYWCYRRARRNVAATIGCYNRGPGRMWSWHKNAITKRYVAKVRRLIGQQRLAEL